MKKQLELAKNTAELFYQTLAVDYFYLRSSLAFVTGIDSLFLNGILYDNDIQSVMPQLTNYFAGFSVPWSVYLHEHQNSQGLLKLGFELIDDAPSMYGDLAAYQELPVAISIKEMKKGDELIDWVACLREGFASKDGCERYRKRNSTILASGSHDLRHFVAYKGNEPVCAGTLFTTKEAIMIHNIATRRAYRKQGFAKEMVTHLLNIAKQSGIQHAYLDATLDALRLYENLGFKTFNRIRCFALKKG